MIQNNVIRGLIGATLAGAFMLPMTLAAQRGQDAGLVGTVRDPSGGAITAATVTASSPQLIGSPQVTTTDTGGAYRFAFLPPGTYQIVAEQRGFERTTRSNVALLPGLVFTVDFEMELAAVTETVRVEAPPPVVDVQSSSAPTLIDRKLLENLPLSRTPTSGIGTAAESVNLAPGVVQGVALGGTFLSNPVTLDGTNGTEPGYGQPTVYPNVNWIEEVQIVSVGASAQYGEYTGALVNAITRSGSNRFSSLADYWTTRPSWTGNNRGGLAPQAQDRFRPIEIAQRWDIDAQLGGPLVKDRVWFFTGGEAYRDAYWPTTFNAGMKTASHPKFDSNEHKIIAKLTSAVSRVVRAEGYVEHATLDVNGVNAGPLIAADALAIYNRPETMWNARLLWTLIPDTFVELRHGGHDFSGYLGPPDNRRSDPPAHYDQLTGVTSGNMIGISDWHDRPVATSAHLTYFVDGGRGNHEIRTGFEYERATLQTFAGYVGGQLFFDFGGQPSEVQLWEGATYRPTQSRRTAYAQDAWRVADWFTLNAGARVGFYRGSVPDHTNAFVLHSLSPRLGGAVDVTGDHRTVIRFHYGRYHDGMVTSFYDFLDPLSQAPFITAAVVGPNQFVEEFRSPTAARASIDPALTYPFNEEYLAAIQRQVPWGLSVTAQFIRRDFKEAIGFIDPARTWLPVQGIDPGPDGRRGTADDGGPIMVYNDQNPSQSTPLLTNPAAAYRRYHGVQLIGAKRYARHVGFQASYTWSRTLGSYNNAAYSNAANADLGLNGVFVNPNRLINTDGRTPQDFTHDVKLLGTYRLERWGGVNLSGFYKYQSGRPWARSAGGFGAATETNLIFVEPRGTRQLPAVNTLDLRLEKTWRPSPKTGILGLFADVFNINNQGVPLRINNASGSNLGVPNLWLEPRTVRVGARFMY